MRGTFLIVASLALLAITPVAAAQQDEAAAKAHFEKGKTLYNSGDYAQALDEFKASYAAFPRWKTRYYIGLALKELKDPVGAEVEFKAYLSEGGIEVPKARKKEVEGLLSELSALLGSIEVNVNVDGAQVFLDGTLVGTSPLTTHFRKEAGEHEIAVKMGGYKDYALKIDLQGNGEREVNVTIEKIVVEVPVEKKVEPITPAPVMQPVEKTVVEKVVKQGTGPLVKAGGALLGLGLASLVIMAGTGGKALSLNGELADDCSKTGDHYECQKNQKDQGKFDDM